MPRAHGLPRWALLLLACAAVAAVAMIPRGVLRTAEASQLGDAAPVAADVLRWESGSSRGAELPGVRAVISREERDAALEAAPDATVPGSLDGPGGGVEGDAVTDLRPAGPVHDHLGHESRAPPSSI